MKEYFKLLEEIEFAEVGILGLTIWASLSLIEWAGIYSTTTWVQVVAYIAADIKFVFILWAIARTLKVLKEDRKAVADLEKDLFND